MACLAFLVSTLGFLGYPEQAQRRAAEAEQLAHQLDHPYSLAFAQYRAGFNALFYRQAADAQRWAEGVVDIAQTHGFPFYEALGTALKGGALIRQGQGEEGRVLLRQGLGHLSRASTQPAPHWLIWQADLCGFMGQFDEGLHLLEEAAVQAEATGNFHAVAELHRLQGEFLIASSLGVADDIEHCFQQALDMARRQEAKILELRAVMSLCRFWLGEGQGEREQARGLLAELYPWFTEGLDTADLSEAKRLLDILA